MLDKLIKNEDIHKMNISDISKIYSDYINPGQVYYFKLLGFNKVLIDHAKGCYYTNHDGQNILDFAGGVGSIGLGHNHPRIIAARKKFVDESRHEIGMSFYSQYVAALSKNLSTIAPGDLKYVILGNTGSEVMEQAIKMVEKYQGPSKHKIIYAKSAFHGRTKGALSVTDSNSLKSTFKLVDNGDIKVRFGDAKELEHALKNNNDVGGVVLESIQGGAGIIIPPEGYLRKVRDLCDQYDVLYIADEIQCGFGRSGKLFAFEYDEVIPDVVTLSKSLGGGKAAVAAAIVRENIYKKAYKDKKDWFILITPKMLQYLTGN
jgi:acetylornithine/succinyldiaminopimelate/putrescine aminotransferase